MVQLGLRGVRFTQRLGPLRELVARTEALLETVNKGADQTVRSELHSQLSCKEMHGGVVNHGNFHDLQ